MATQQQFPLDPNTALAPIWMRNGGRQRQTGELLQVQSATMQREQLRSYAHMEARSWQVIDPKERLLLLDVKWKDAKESIETRCRSLRDGAAAGRKLNSEAKTLADHIALFRESLQEVRAAMEPQLGYSLGAVQLHTGTSASVAAMFCAEAATSRSTGEC